MPKRDGKQEQKKVIHHKEGTEWLTHEICNYYKDKAKEIRNHSISDKEFGDLCKELIDRCDITELQAINILNGYYINDYVALYAAMREPSGLSVNGNNDTKEYLEWLANKEERDQSLNDYDLPD